MLQTKEFQQINHKKANNRKNGQKALIDTLENIYK